MWRDGQKQRVFVYRFLTTGTIEEKAGAAAPWMKRQLHAPRGLGKANLLLSCCKYWRSPASCLIAILLQVFQRQLSKESLQQVCPCFPPSLVCPRRGFATPLPNLQLALMQFPLLLPNELYGSVITISASCLVDLCIPCLLLRRWWTQRPDPRRGPT